MSYQAQEFLNSIPQMPGIGVGGDEYDGDPLFEPDYLWQGAMFAAAEEAGATREFLGDGRHDLTFPDGSMLVGNCNDRSVEARKAA